MGEERTKRITAIGQRIDCLCGQIGKSDREIALITDCIWLLDQARAAEARAEAAERDAKAFEENILEECDARERLEACLAGMARALDAGEWSNENDLCETVPCAVDAVINDVTYWKAEAEEWKEFGQNADKEARKAEGQCITLRTERDAALARVKALETERDNLPDVTERALEEANYHRSANEFLTANLNRATEQRDAALARVAALEEDNEDYRQNEEPLQRRVAWYQARVKALEEAALDVVNVQPDVQTACSHVNGVDSANGRSREKASSALYRLQVACDALRAALEGNDA